MPDLSIRRQIAAELLTGTLSEDGFAPCPGQAAHTGRTGPRDFRIVLEGPPTAYCFHASCAGAVEQFNRELRSRIGKAESGNGNFQATGAFLGRDVAAPPAATSTLPKRTSFDASMLAGFAARCPQPEITLEWLRKRSPVAIPEPSAQDRETAAYFLAALFTPAERVLVFTAQWSQGDFLWDGSAGVFRLAAKKDVAPVASPLPTGGPEGVWFLCQPVTAEWCVNPYAARTGGPSSIGRRHGGCVTAWRYLVLESDQAPVDQWLRALVQLPLPIAAIYTSGGRSVHALARVDARNKGEWDAVRDKLLPVLCPLGADPGAMTAVRLTRLPGMLRHGSHANGQRVPWPSGKLQELAWLNPRAAARPIVEILSR